MMACFQSLHFIACHTIKSSRTGRNIKQPIKKITTLQNKTVQPSTGSYPEDRKELARRQKGK
jgi:hypothetical protein